MQIFTKYFNDRNNQVTKIENGNQFRKTETVYTYDKDGREKTAKTAAKKKLGFPVPIRVWLKEDKYYNLVKNTFKSESGRKFFNTREIVKLLDDHRSGKCDNSRKIWTVFMFLVWYKVYFENNGRY